MCIHPIKLIHMNVHDSILTSLKLEISFVKIPRILYIMWVKILMY